MAFFIPVLAVAGLAAVLFGASGCGGETASSPDVGGDRAPGPDRYVAPAPTAIPSGTPPPPPTRTVAWSPTPLAIGDPPAGANTARIQEWAGEEAINRTYLGEYNRVYPGLYAERRVAIRRTIMLLLSETRDNPMRVTYTGGTAPLTIDNPAAIFVRRLVASSPEAVRDDVRREAEAAIRELNPGAGDGSPSPRPAGSDTPRPRVSGSPRPSAPPPTRVWR